MSASILSAPQRPPVRQGLPAAQQPPVTGSGSGDKPTNIGPTFLAASAILTGSSALGTPITGSSWVLPLIEVVAVIWLVGVGGRLIRLPTSATALLQLAGFVIALTSLFTSTGIGGVLPNSSAVGEAGTLLSGAWQQIVGTSPPAPSTPELSFLISLAIGCAAFIADFLVAEARSPALVALPLLCLYSVPASIASTMLPWYSFAVPAVLYAVLLAVTGHRGRRTGARAELGLAVNGGVIIALATAAALFIAGSTTSIGTTGRLPHTSGGANGSIGLSPLASLRGSLQSSVAVNVLTASGLSAPDYFRTVALTTWTPNEGWSLGQLAADIPDVDGALTGGLPLSTSSTISVTTQGYQDRFLPILTGTTSISGLGNAWNFDSTLDTVYRADKVKPGRYELTVDQVKPTAAQLEGDSVLSGGDLTETGSLAASVRATAQAVTQAESGAFDKARALEQWFTNAVNGFRYSLSVPAGNSGDALVDFLTNKRGFCEQYASAMAIMLRSLNIPSRVVVGFTQGVKQANGTYLITSHDAHAWVEVQFQDYGWVRFDPTPPVDGQGGQQGFQDGGASASTSATTATPTISGTSRRPDGGTTTKPTGSSAVATQVDVASGPAGSSSGWVSTGLIILAVVALILALLMIPTALRIRRRSRRMAVVRSAGPGAAAAAWAEIEDTAIDHGILPHAAESARVTANRLARRAHLSDADRVRLRAVVVAAEQHWYGVPEVTAVSDATAAAAADANSAADGHLETVGAVGSSGVTGKAGTAATMLLERPSARSQVGAQLAGAVSSIVAGLHEHAPVRLTDRLVPASLRRTGR